MLYAHLLYAHLSKSPCSPTTSNQRAQKRPMRPAQQDPSAEALIMYIRRRTRRTIRSAYPPSANPVIAFSRSYSSVNS